MKLIIIHIHVKYHSWTTSRGAVPRNSPGGSPVFQSLLFQSQSPAMSSKCGTKNIEELSESSEYSSTSNNGDDTPNACPNGALSSPDSAAPLRCHVDTGLITDSFHSLSLKTSAQSIAERDVEYVDITKSFLEATKGKCYNRHALSHL